MSVQQEHRYRRLVISQGNLVNDRQRMVEAMFMTRAPRHTPTPPTTNASRRQVRSWMRRNAEVFETATELAEAANATLDFPPGAMDDDGHWLWDEALAAIDAKGGQHD